MSSRLLVAAKAAGNSDDFRARVEVACTLANLEFSHDVAVKVAYACADSIILEPFVDTDGVSDEAIKAEVQSILDGATVEDEGEGE